MPKPKQVKLVVTLEQLPFNSDIRPDFGKASDWAEIVRQHLNKSLHVANVVSVAPNKGREIKRQLASQRVTSQNGGTF